MKKILQRGLLFFVVFFSLSLVIRAFLPDKPYWGNTEYFGKIDAYKKKDSNLYNTVFFGSSRILTGLNPIIFDSLINKSSPVKIKSFNLASAGTWFNETYYLYNKFLEDPRLHDNIDLVLMEFQNVMSIAWDKISSDKVIYYQNAKNLQFVADYSIHEHDRWANKTFKSVHYIGSYGLAYFENLLNVGKSDLIFPTATNIDSEESRGYKELLFNPQLVSETEIKKYTENITKHLAGSQMTFNKSFHEKLMEMISRSKEKGIKLIFILPPVKLTDRMIAVFKSLPDTNKIEICDTKKYRELYLAKNWSDQTHFNNNGAEIFTKYVVDKIIPLSH